MIKEKLFNILLAAILIISFASALTASISNPRMVLYKNISEGKILEFENSVSVNNDNQEDVRIAVRATGIWRDKAIIEEQDFVMKKGERKDVFYTIKIDKAGYYEGDILVTFYDNSKNELSVAQDLVVIVSDESGKVAESKGSLWIWAVSIIVLASILTFLLRLNKKKRKR